MGVSSSFYADPLKLSPLPQLPYLFVQSGRQTMSLRQVGGVCPVLLCHSLAVLHVSCAVVVCFASDQLLRSITQCAHVKLAAASLSIDGYCP
jgi:hypothetical protein